MIAPRSMVFDPEILFIYLLMLIANVKEDKAGCEGILRDFEGVARGVFYGDAGSNNAEVAKIGEVKIAFEMFASMNWKSSISMVIELGSPKVFSWCINKKLRPWSLHVLFSDIESAKGKVDSFVFSLVNGNGNDMAFSLALAGVNRPQVFKAW
ncbi:hypothetical protein J1N35_033395 [Gossypium stocksii]|uniref:Uncharacterized protein n=1 Tax=Gossypium stocksii TaxID=47602 RepID=A0A9D3ZPJ9_9ROSI|nr:hypothetical protein J1N35_033395 [Gossypium stocksii]